MSTTTVLYDFVSAALCSTDDLPRKSEAHCYTKRHAKIMLHSSYTDNRCNSEDSDQPARPLSRITSFFPKLRLLKGALNATTDTN